MKKYKVTAILLVLVTVLFSVSCNRNKQEKSSAQTVASRLEVLIEGMTCTGCEQTIQRNVGKLEGVKSVKASFSEGRAIIEYLPDMVDTLKIREAVTGSGYKVNRFIDSTPDKR